MSLFIDDMLLRLHRLIRTKSTGTPKVLAKKLKCSKRTVYYKLDELKSNNCPVIWDKERQSYCYTEEVSLFYSLKIGDKEMERIVGGSNGGFSVNFENNFRSAMTLHPPTIALPLFLFEEDTNNSNKPF